MTTITHREMCNSSAEVLRRVEAGETITVTNHGHPVARLSPMTRTVLEELEQLGQVRLETLLLASLSRPRLKSDVTTAELISDVRGYDRGY